MVTESLRTGEKEVNLIYEAANIMGVDVIKLIWSKKGDSIRKVVGFHVPTRYSISGYNPMVESSDVPLVFDAARFYPDNNRFRWGYVLDTEYNRQILKEHLSTGFFQVQDASIRREIMKEAEKDGLRTTPAPHKEISVRRTAREEALVQVAETTEAELRRLKAELAKKEMELKKAKNKKPRKVKDILVEADKIEGDGGDKFDIDSIIPPVIKKK